MKKLSEIEGLRGYLALYVVLFHAKKLSGYNENHLLNRFLEGSLAVDVFIIVSGFVIFFLLKSKCESYIPYITRRFFRLYPLYIVLFFSGLIISPIALENASYLSVYDQSYSSYWVSSIDTWNVHKLTNIISHLFMLHGIIPQSIIPSGSEAFLVPAWSISLEWQFYLLAPAMFLLIRKKLAAFVVIIVICFLLKPIIPGSKHGAFLLEHIGFFFCGIITFHFFEKVPIKGYLTELQLLALLLFSVFLATINGAMLPVAGWLVFFSVLYFSRVSFREKWPVIIFKFLFNNRICQFLGRISYSLYLSHFLVINILQNLLFKRMANLGQLQHYLLLTILTVLVSVTVSIVLYYLVEKPGISFGRQLATKIGRSNPVGPNN